MAYLGAEPVGWCAVGPRPGFLRLTQEQTVVPWAGRSEVKADGGVWAVACFVTRAGFRRRGVGRALALASVDFARERGARALEGYPITTTDVILEELHVGTRALFAGAGFIEISSPTLRRVVMRIDF